MPLQAKWNKFVTQQRVAMRENTYIGAIE